MENAAKALTIAGNVLLAVIILSLVMYFYNTWRQLPLEEEAKLLTEQAQEFNKQYEVFDKKLMYGVDVLSCVNKAISNNAKYITGIFDTGDPDQNANGAGWLSGTLSSSEFAIEVEVILKEPLQEQVDVYFHEYSTTSHFDASTNTTTYDSSYKEQKEFCDRGSDGASSISFRDLSGLNTTRPKFKIPSDEYVDQMYDESGLSNWDDVKLKTQTIDLVTDIGPFEDTVGSYYRYTLLHGEYDKNVINENDVFLKKLIETISTFTTSDSQIIYNNDDSTLTKWSKIEWVPAVSAFKNKKFRCEGINESTGRPNGTPGIQYNERTGAINKLTFVEYSIPSE